MARIALLPFVGALLVATAACPASRPPRTRPTYLGPVQAELVFENRVPTSFVLTKATWEFQQAKYPIDAVPAPGQQVHVADVPTQSGDTTMRLTMTLQGNGYGVFSYLKGYTFQAKAEPTVLLDAPRVRIVCGAEAPADPPTVPLEQRPRFNCVVVAAP